MPSGDIYSLLKTDAEKEAKGVEVDIGDGIKIRVARFNNEEFQSYWEAITKPFRRQIENNTISKEDLRELMIDAISETVLLGWSGVKVKGKEFPYSKDNAMTLLRDLKEFRDIVSEESRRFEHFRAQDMEDDKGNSKRSSAGSSSGDRTSAASATA